MERAPRVRFVRSFEAGQMVPCPADEDWLCKEEPLEIRLARFSLAVLMRTPGQDEELALGFCWTEGIISSHRDLVSIKHCSEASEDSERNVLVLTPREDFEWNPAAHQRNFVASASCGVCGKRTIEQALRRAPPLLGNVAFSSEILAPLPERLREQQSNFARTGACHAAGVFDVSGAMLVLREDVGRHNATDKVIGWAIRNERSLDTCVLVISGRASFEIVQKALAARLAAVVAVGGVSSLALDLARSSRMTLAGFVQKGGLSVYHGATNLEE